MDRNDIRKVLAKDAKLYIFDMDGTILNSMVEWFHLGRNYLVAQGVAVPDDLEQRIETMTNDESRNIFSRLEWTNLSRKLMKEFLPIFEKNIVRRSRQRKECWI